MLNNFESAGPDTDPLAKLIIHPKEHIEMLPDPKVREKKRFALREKTPGPKAVFILGPARKHATPLHKRLAKLEIRFGTAADRPVLRARLVKWGLSLQERIEGRMKRAKGKVMKKQKAVPEYWAKRNKDTINKEEKDG